MRRARTGRSGRPALELAFLGALARDLLGDSLLASLDCAAELLRRTAAADDCEILLREPEGGDLILSVCQGRDREALHERTRFGLGVGFPGIAAETGRAVLTRHLDRDRRFLRRGVVRAGVTGFVTAPLWSEQGPVGCVSLAWRNGAARVGDGAELLQQAAGVLMPAVRAGLLAAREAVDRAADEAGAGRDACSRVCLEALVAAAGARGGTLALYHQSGAAGAALYSTAAPMDICADALDGRARCSLVAPGHGVALCGAREGWPSACRRLPQSVVAPVCLPLRLRDRLTGVVVLDRGPSPPTPPTRDLVPLLTMAREAAYRLAATTETVTPASQAGEAVLEIRCLGRFEVLAHGRPLAPSAFARRKALALLKFLVLNAGNPVNRYALVEHLWPGVSEAVGTNRLHGVLHALRNAVEPSRQERRWEYVCGIHDCYYFNLESSHWIDMHAFRRYAAMGQDAARRGRSGEAIRHLEAALELYRGDLFEDEPYADWCEVERSELRQRSVDLMRQLAELRVKGGDPERGLVWLRQALRADPLREDLHQMLIRTLLALGRRGEARGQYVTWVRLLREELGAEPLPETRALAPALFGPGLEDPRPDPASSPQ